MFCRFSSYLCVYSSSAIVLVSQILASPTKEGQKHVPKEVRTWPFAWSKVVLVIINKLVTVIVIIMYNYGI